MEEFQRDCRQGCLLVLRGLGEMLGGHLRAVVYRQRSNLFEVEEQQNSVSKKSQVSPLAWHCEETPPGQREAQPHGPLPLPGSHSAPTGHNTAFGTGGGD